MTFRTAPAAACTGTGQRGKVRSAIQAILLILTAAWPTAPVLAQPRRQQAAPQSYAVPLAVAAGRTSEIVFRGPDVAGAKALRASFQAEASFDADSADVTKVRLTVPASAPVGVGVVRLITPRGMSSLIPVMVDDLPTINEVSGNSTPAGAQSLVFPVAVEGACDEQGYDYYRLTGRNGQRVSVEVVAARLGSQLDPVLRLLDSNGKELAYREDAPGAGPDCRFAFTCPADGDYLLELRDVNYAGGAAYRYRLRVGDFPLVTTAYPLAGRHGATAEFAFLGADASRLPMLLASLPAKGVAQPIDLRYPDGRGSGFASLPLSDLAEQVEAAPNGTPDSATPLSVPGAVSGRFDRPGDRDWFRFDATKGQRLSFRSRTRSLGCPCDASLAVYKPDGSRLAASKADGPGEATLDVAIPADGAYRLRIEELNRAGGPDLAYRVEVVQGRVAPFSLSVETDAVGAAPGGEFTLKVTAVRQGYNGPIKLTPDGLAPDVKLEGETIADGKTEAQLKVKLPPAYKPDGLVQFSLTGTAETGDAPVAAPVSTLPALQKVFPRLLYPPNELDGRIALVIRGD
jgi:hypothetical protein